MKLVTDQYDENQWLVVDEDEVDEEGVLGFFDNEQDSKDFIEYLKSKKENVRKKK